MDPKAAAKSKRSQSQQGKKNHPTPSAASARSQQKKKEPILQQKQPQQQGEQRIRRDLRALPSNWDRYSDDEIEADSGVSLPPLPSSSGGGETVLRKSKGADFGRLIAEASSQARGRDHGDGRGPLPSDFLFDEAMPDLSSLVSIRGDSLISWCSNDNFKVDINARSTFEVPFLSLDLLSLEAQISKASLAERLFMEEDYLPDELVNSPLTLSTRDFPDRDDSTEKSHESIARRIKSVDELLEDVDFLSPGPTTAQRPIQSVPTLSSLDESIDDLLAETSSYVGLKRAEFPRNPAGNFHEQ